MNPKLNNLMRDAARLTRGGHLKEATALLQQWLGGSNDSPPRPAAEQGRPASDVLDGCVFEIDGAQQVKAASTLEQGPAAAAEAPAPTSSRAPRSAEAFVSGVHTHASLTRHYKLYIPPGASDSRALPLVVMLHGCTQNPDDFAAGTGMNERARQQGFFVLYPAQSQEANASRCWNWFKHNHQQRDRGEPALIASLTQQLLREHPIDRDRVYVAGLSAGGAMAAILGSAYPDIYAAVGVHSGLAPGAASNVGEALSAMNGVASGALPLGLSALKQKAAVPAKLQALEVPTIVFHGDQDKTVNPVNGRQVIDARLAGNAAPDTAPELERGTSSNGRGFTRQVYRDSHGGKLGEHWIVHGAGHAWFGGHPAGSYTDPLGPDATGEMLRFFFEHGKRGSQVP